MDTKNFETVEEVAEVAVGETKKMESSPETESNDTDVEVAVNDVLTGIEEVDKDIRRLQERQLELLELLDPDSLASYHKAKSGSNITVSKKKSFKKKKAKRRMAKKSKK